MNWISSNLAQNNNENNNPADIAIPPNIGV